MYELVDRASFNVFLTLTSNPPVDGVELSVCEGRHIEVV
jgi:hypothetical protein